MASKEDIAQAMDKQATAAAATAATPATHKEVDPTTSQTAGGVKLEHMQLNLEDLKALGEEKLKAELRARGKDFRGNDVSDLAARLLRVVRQKQRIQRKGNFAQDSDRNSDDSSNSNSNGSTGRK